ncbi:MAG: LacI family transcriptional regulator [Lentisphaerae bacterium]|nr:LacI family transcriptional regulator [Lentisphaerota bacterium]
MALRDIAKDVGVSVSLVSKVLNQRLGTTGVSAATNAAVLSAAEQRGYRKNASAVALLAGRHNILGVYLHSPGMAGSGILEELLEGISDAAFAHHQRLQLNFFSTPAEFQELCADAHQGDLDGLVVGGIANTVSVDRLRAIRAGGLPVVTLYDHPIHPSLFNVGIDHARVTRLATAHLIAQGARRIAHICNMEARHDGYRQALAAAGIPYDAARVYDAHALDFGHITGEQAVAFFMRRRVPFDGIVAQSDQEAMGCLNMLFQRGCRVPDDVLVIGIDDAPYCAFARVPLSSVSQNYRRQGQEAIRLVLAVIAGQRVRSTKVEPLLVVRDSSHRTPALDRPRDVPVTVARGRQPARRARDRHSRIHAIPSPCPSQRHD